MSNNSITISGLGQTIQLLQTLGVGAQGDLDGITETYARKMSEESAALAPIDTSALKNSIAASPQPTDNVHVWEWGSNLPYAVKMEYTHATNKAFIRKAVWNNREKYRKAVIKRLTEG